MNITIQLIPESVQLIKISDEEYFNNPEWKNHISNSRLGLINPDEDGSIEKYLNGLDSTYSASYEVGTAVHNMTLQPEYYEIAPIFKPSAKMGLFADKAYELGARDENVDKNILKKASEKSDYYSKSFTENRIKSALEKCVPYWKDRAKWESENVSDKDIMFLSEKIFDTQQLCMNSILSDRQIVRTLRPSSLDPDSVESYNEYAIIASIKVIFEDKFEHILHLKGKLDNFIINHETEEIVLNDLKTTGKNGKYFMGNEYYSEETGKTLIDGSFQKYHYYRQMAMYGWLLKCYCLSRDIQYPMKSNMLVVETIPDHAAFLYSVKNEYIQKGLNEFKKLISIIAHYERRCKSE